MINPNSRYSISSLRCNLFSLSPSLPSFSLSHSLSPSIYLSLSLSLILSLPTLSISPPYISPSPLASLHLRLPADHGIGGLLCHCLVAWSPWFIFLLYTYDYLYFIIFSFQIVSSFVRDSSYHDMYYKGCGLLCAHKKSFNTAIPVRSLGPYMCVHYCTYIVYILV